MWGEVHALCKAYNLEAFIRHGNQRLELKKFAERLFGVNDIGTFPFWGDFCPKPLHPRMLDYAARDATTAVFIIPILHEMDSLKYGQGE